MREIPMPGEKVDGYVVVASCWLIDEVGHDAQAYGDDGYYRGFVILLNPREPFYRVVDIESYYGSGEWHAAAIGEFFPNIIPAAECYSDIIGGY